jgi:hypothetical protein
MVVELSRVEVGGLSGILVFVRRCATRVASRTGTVPVSTDKAPPALKY